MKIGRFIKLRKFSRGPEDLALEENRNPLKRKLTVQEPTHTFTAKFLEQFKAPLDIEKARNEPYGFSYPVIRIVSDLYIGSFMRRSPPGG